MTLLVAILLKSLLLFALTGLALLCLRRASAAVRHLVCLLTLAALLVLPVLSLALPGWILPFAALPIAAPTDSASAAAPLSAAVDASPAVLSSAVPPVLVMPAAASVSPGVPRRGFPWPMALAGVWLLGAFLAALRPLLGFWGIGRLHRVCVPVTDDKTRELAVQGANALRLAQIPTLLQAVVAVPMTWGWRRPVVLLPESASGWPNDRCQAVLLHEMAHIRRGDWLWHRLADIVCALYWFHPLVWGTARRLRAEGEIACDDLVLSSGIAAPDYARHLLEIARALPPKSAAPQAVLAMAQTSHIEGRLKMILDKTQSRRQTTGRVVMTALALSAVVFVPLAMLHPIAKAQSVASTPSVSASAHDLQASGPQVSSAAVPIELAGVTDAKEPGGNWWSASGASLSKPVFNTATSHDYQTTLSFNPGQRSLLFAFRLPPSAKNVTTLLSAPNSMSSSSGGVLARQDAGPGEFRPKRR